VSFTLSLGPHGGAGWLGSRSEAQAPARVSVHRSRSADPPCAEHVSRPPNGISNLHALASGLTVNSLSRRTGLVMCTSHRGTYGTGRRPSLAAQGSNRLAGTWHGWAGRSPFESNLPLTYSAGMTRCTVVGSIPSTAARVGRSWSANPFISISTRAKASAAETDWPSARAL